MKPIRVLVIDDSPVFLRSMAKFLGDFDDIEVEGLANGGEAGMAQALELTPDVALIDLAMPGLDGFTLIPKIRETLPSTKIIAMTLYTKEYYEESALSKGADAFISKARLSSEIVPLVRQLAHANEAEAAPETGL